MTISSQQLNQLLATLQLDDAPAGSSVSVYQNCACIASASVGMATPNEKWADNTLALNFSTGKGILVTLIHILVSKGLLNYDSPIADYWSEFEANGKSEISLKSVLTHRANLFNVQAITDSPLDVLNWHSMLQKVQIMSPQAPLNIKAESCYSALISGWILGGLIEKVTNLSLNMALEKFLTKPLNIEGEVYFGVPKAKLSQIATLPKNFDNPLFASEINRNNKNGELSHNSKKRNKNKRDSTKSKSLRHKPTLKIDNQKILDAYATLPSYECWTKLRADTVPNDKVKGNLSTFDIVALYLSMQGINPVDFKHSLMPKGWPPLDLYSADALSACIPAANGVASSRALAKVYSMLANKGVWKGKVLIKPEVFNEASKIQVKGSDAIMPSYKPNSMQWRLGYHRIFTRCFGTSVLNSGFGHMGYNGSMAWCDPNRNLAVAYVHNYDTTMTTDVRQFVITETILKWFE